MLGVPHGVPVRLRARPTPHFLTTPINLPRCFRPRSPTNHSPWSPRHRSTRKTPHTGVCTANKYQLRNAAPTLQHRWNRLAHTASRCAERNALRPLPSGVHHSHLGQCVTSPHTHTTASYCVFRTPLSQRPELMACATLRWSVLIHARVQRAPRAFPSTTIRRSSQDEWAVTLRRVYFVSISHYCSVRN